MKILITGATGYIGERLLKKSLMYNHEVIAASRRKLSQASSWLYFDFASTEHFALPKGVDVVIHLAANTSYKKEDKECEIRSARTLLSQAQKAGAKFLFISSQTARKDFPTSYGQTKWCIEQEVLNANGLVVKPGQVYGGKTSGLFGSLVNIVKQSVLLPAFLPAPLIQPIHVDDLVEGLLKLAEHPNITSGLFCLASPNPISFTHFLRTIALHKVRKRRHFIMIPSIVVKFLINLSEHILFLKPHLTRLHSLFSLHSMDTANDLKTLDLNLRPLHSGMHPSGDNTNRKLIQESIILLTYLIKKKPTSELIRRYVRMIKQLRFGSPLNLPAFTYYWPITLAIIDNPSYIASLSGKEFGWRINAATVIAEASQQGAASFLGDLQPSNRFLSLFKILVSLGAEAMWHIMSFIYRLFIRFSSRGYGASNDSGI